MPLGNLSPAAKLAACAYILSGSRACRYFTPAEALPDPGQHEVTHRLKWTKTQQLQQETDVKGQVYSAIVDYAIGSGDRGLTLVGRDHKDAAFELRLSRYRSGSSFQWDVTSGHIRHPMSPHSTWASPLIQMPCAAA